jgi:hypothetical protein
VISTYFHNLRNGQQIAPGGLLFRDALFILSWRAGILGALGTLFFWIILIVALESLPERLFFWFRWQDVSIPYLIVFWPWIVGIFFWFFALLAVCAIWSIPGMRLRLRIAQLLLLMPSLTFFVAVNFVLSRKHPFVWEFRLSETAILLVGIFLGRMRIWRTVAFDRTVSERKGNT